jgi:hypothetical protein
MSTGGTTNKNRNNLINRLLRFFIYLIRNILATNHMFYAKREKLKYIMNSYPKHRGIGFRKRFFYWYKRLRFDM